MTYNGTYAGFVVSASDPAKVGRVKARVPILHGTIQSSYEVIADADLPWALPAGMPAGNSSSSGGLSHLPQANDQVWIRYLDGELEKPVWEWGNETLPGLQNWPETRPLHAYEADGSPTSRAAWLRYNQQILLTPTGIEASTLGGYRFTMSDSLTPTSKDGQISWTTAAGSYVALDDTSSSFTVVAPNFYAITELINFYATVSTDLTSPLINVDFGRLAFVGDYGGHIIDAVTRTAFGVQGQFNSLGLGALSTIAIGAPSVYIASGGVAFYPDGTPIPPAVMAFGSNSNNEVWLATGGPDDGLVRLSDLQFALAKVKQWLMTHQHTGVRGGSDISGPPAQVPIFDCTASAQVSAEGLTTNYASA